MTTQDIIAEAYAAGLAAGNECKPRPMTVVEADIFGRPLREARPSVVADGACGFAWVRIKGNTRFAREAKALGVTRKGWPKGLDIPVRDHNQSVERKEAHARAYAAVLRKYGIDAYADSRLD